MEIVWDEPKRIANIEKHRLDFADVPPEFFEIAVYRPGHSGRWRALGRMTDRKPVAVIFQPLGAEAVSIVSLRPASHKERRLIDDQEND